MSYKKRKNKKFDNKPKKRIHKDALWNHLESIEEATKDCALYLNKECPETVNWDPDEKTKYTEKLDKVESAVWDLRTNLVFW